MRARVVVIGGGIMGLCAAHELARRLDPLEDPVLLLERAELGAGSSGRSGAILRCHYADREVAAMARDSLRFYSGFAARTGRQIGFEACGVLTLAGPQQPEWLERVARNTAMLQSIGVRAELCGAARLRELVAGLDAHAGTLACYEPEGGFVDPQRALEAIAAVARWHGAITQVGRPAASLWIEQGRIRGVHCADGSIESEAVVLAGGPWTRSLLAQHGIELPLQVVRPENHYLAAERLAPLAAGGEHRSPHPVLIDLQHGFYARCDPAHSRTRVGSIDHASESPLEDPDTLVEEVSEATRRFTRRALSARLPRYAQEPDSGSIAAWYTLSPDHQPLLGPLPALPGLFVAAGFSGHGFKLGPSVGEGLAQLVLGEALSAFDRDFFAPERFAQARASSSTPFGL